MRPCRLLMLGPLAVALGCASSKGELYAHLSDTVVRLSNGDSVEIQATVPAVIPDGKPGTMVIYYPFRDFSDTVRLEQTAVALLAQLRPHFDSAPPPFLVLRAVNRRSRDRKGFYRVQYYGVVVQQHADGHWYLLGASQPVL